MTHPDLKSEQAHYGCEWLDEEDGEQKVLGNRRRRDRQSGSPRITQHQRGKAGRKKHSVAKNCAGDRSELKLR